MTTSNNPKREKRQQVYLGLGGNIGPTAEILQSALKSISALNGVYDLRCSAFFETTPVSDIPQNIFINAACTFSTTLSAQQLLEMLQKITLQHGQTPKPKNAPRILDIDILFFGTELHKTPTLEIPHPRWNQRLFVLLPLLDLTSQIDLPNGDGTFSKIDIKTLVDTFDNRNNERVFRIPHNGV